MDSLPVPFVTARLAARDSLVWWLGFMLAWVDRDGSPVYGGQYVVSDTGMMETRGCRNKKTSECPIRPKMAAGG